MPILEPLLAFRESIKVEAEVEVKVEAQRQNAVPGILHFLET